jgi:hypothetical protein
MLRFLKEIYLTSFTILFRLGGGEWPHEINAWKGVVGIALIQGIVLLAIEGWLEIFTGSRFLPHIPKLAVVAAFLILSFCNYYGLVLCRHGVVFEQEFDKFARSKKILLLTICVEIILVAITFFIYSAVRHRHFIGVD